MFPGWLWPCRFKESNNDKDNFFVDRYVTDMNVEIESTTRQSFSDHGA